MRRELDRILSGGLPSADYTYNLCPNRVYDASEEPITPVLGNSFILCGEDGNPDNSCTVLGGRTQVEIDAPLSYSFSSYGTTFTGIRFTMFTNASVAARGIPPQQVTFDRVTWSVSVRRRFTRFSL
jgi:hypothetical protein